jgi:hypothetical protein
MSAATINVAPSAKARLALAMVISRCLNGSSPLDRVTLYLVPPTSGSAFQILATCSRGAYQRASRSTVSEIGSAAVRLRASPPGL